MKEELKEKLIHQYGENTTNEIINALSKEKYTTFRVNTIKSNKEEIEEVLKKEKIDYEKVSWSDIAYILPNCSNEKIRSLDIYNEGKIYLQSLSSQLPPIFLNPKSQEMILDMAAAPGGKTTQMAALSNNEAMITAVEMNKERAERLKYNIEKQGAKKVTLLNVNSKNLNEYFIFDKILLDSPCSGSGTIKSVNNFKTELVDKIVVTQHTLLEEAIKHLKVNGEIVYSTCSILQEENEDVINDILNKYDDIELVPLNLDLFEDIPQLESKIPGTLCVKPNEKYEGFFVAKLRKTNKKS